VVREMAAEKVTLHLDLSGKRAINYFRYGGVKPEHAYTKFEDKPRFEEVEELANRYLKGFIDGSIDRVQVAYMKFINAAVQGPVIETLLPLDAVPGAGAEAKDKPKEKVEYEFLPAADEILAQLLPESFKVRLFKCFLDAAVSEQIARR